MKTEREMLEYAALACGLEHHRYFDSREAMAKYTIRDGWFAATWHPSEDDGDCARMEATLGIDVEWSASAVYCSSRGAAPYQELYSCHRGNKQAARRMASLRAAAEIGESMP